MRHRRIRRANAREEGFFRLLFLALMFLSIVRVIDLLPPLAAETMPAFSVASPMPSEEPKATEDPASSPQPLFVSEIGTAVIPKGIDLRGSEPKILIYHTHTTEAYTATKSSPYVQTTAFRTTDASKSVLAVGDALAERLRKEYGFSVIHDTTDHEPPSLKTAYDRSERTMQSYLEKYPSLILFIDIHRDASSDTSDYVIVNGSPTARLMCVVGQGIKYKIKPDFERNYSLAMSLTEHLRQVEPRLARDVRVKNGRYNQHVGRLNLLIEVGHNANTLEQALNAVPSLAESLALTLAEMDGIQATDQEDDHFCRLLVPDWAGIDKK